MNHLYRHFDKEGNLLYVGISLSAINRLGQHKENAHWFNSISRVDIETYTTREEARCAEKKAITDENPLHNIYRPSLKEQNEVYQDSKDDLVRRIVQFNPVYSIDDVASLLRMTKNQILKEFDSGNLSYIEVEGKKSGNWPIKMHKRVTGWQLIDYIEHLENIHRTASSGAHD